MEISKKLETHIKSQLDDFLNELRFTEKVIPCYRKHICVVKLNSNPYHDLEYYENNINAVNSHLMKLSDLILNYTLTQKNSSLCTACYTSKDRIKSIKLRNGLIVFLGFIKTSDVLVNDLVIEVAIQ